MDCAVWIEAVNTLLRRDWCLSIEDAGIDDDQLTRAWADGDAPAAYVAWFAENYDLIRFEAWPLRRPLSSFPPPA